MKNNTIRDKLILTGITLFFTSLLLGLFLLSIFDLWFSALVTAAGVFVHWCILRIRALEQQVDDLRQAVFHKDEQSDRV